MRSQDTAAAISAADTGANQRRRIVHRRLGSGRGDRQAVASPRPLRSPAFGERAPPVPDLVDHRDHHDPHKILAEGVDIPSDDAEALAARRSPEHLGHKAELIYALARQLTLEH